MITGIYGIRHKASKRWYVGQAYDIRKRFKDHKAFTATNTRKHLYLALRKYGFTAFAWRILERCDKPDLNRKEKFWIQKLNSVEPNGYNLTTGGDRRFTFTPSVLEKMRRASLGRVQSQETIQKRVEKNIGQRRTIVTRRKMRKAQLGKKASEATKRKLSRIFKRIHSSPEKVRWNRERMLKQWRNREYRRRLRKAHRGFKPSESARRKLSRRSTERWKDPVFRQMMIKSFTGRRHSKATILRIAKSNTGKKRSEKWKAGQSERIRELWKNSSYRKRMVKAHIGFKQTKASIARRIKKIRGRRKYTIQDMQKLVEKHGGRCLSRKYDGILKPLKWLCRKGHKWTTQPTSIVAGSWCPYCMREKMSERFRTKNATQKYRNLARKHGGVLLSRKAPRNQREHLQWRCQLGHTFWSNPNNVLNGKWCRRCANIARKKIRSSSAP